jgi:hypothetical protein
MMHWQRHYPCDFVTPMALNSRGEQIYYRVDSDQDRMWVWRMERAVDHHMAVRERDLPPTSTHVNQINTIISNVSDSFIPCQPISTYFKQNRHISTLQ